MTTRTYVREPTDEFGWPLRAAERLFYRTYGDPIVADDAMMERFARWCATGELPSAANDNAPAPAGHDTKKGE